MKSKIGWRLRLIGRNYHVVIIGGGFAGLAAADLLARHKLTVLVVDENVHTGGQLLRKMLRSPGKVTLSEPDQLKRVGYPRNNQLI